MSLSLRSTRRLARRWRGPQWLTLLTLLSGSPYATAGVEDAMKKCLKGRCAQGGNPQAGQLPDYNLGWGYTCDFARLLEYYRCQEEQSDECLRKAEQKKRDCIADPCPVVYSQCMAYPCKKTSKDRDCWQGTGDNAKFGYWDWVGGDWVFVPVNGDEVPAETWKRVCEGQKARCEAGRRAKKGDKLTPITRTFCSAKCAGHNCHHAAAQICACLETERAGDARIVVFDDEWVHDLPCKPGNLAHSMITVPHPADPNQRCLIESQSTCANPVVDPKCCFLDNAPANDPFREFRKLEGVCPLVEWKEGPHTVKLDFRHLKEYADCNAFLEARGTCKPEVLERIARERGGWPSLGAAEPEVSTPECVLTCGPEGAWREVWEDNYAACPAGHGCRAPEGMPCPEPPDTACEEESEPPTTCGPASCEVGDETVPLFRGSCEPVPVPSPSPSPGPTPSPSPGPSPTPSPTPYPSLFGRWPSKSSR